MAVLGKLARESLFYSSLPTGSLCIAVAPGAVLIDTCFCESIFVRICVALFLLCFEALYRGDRKKGCLSLDETLVQRKCSAVSCLLALKLLENH